MRALIEQIETRAGLPPASAPQRHCAGETLHAARCAAVKALRSISMIWALSAEGFVPASSQSIPSPLGIGNASACRTDGRGRAFVEPEAIKGARDISESGGWRAFMASQGDGRRRLIGVHSQPKRLSIQVTNWSIYR